MYLGRPIARVPTAHIIRARMLFIALALPLSLVACGDDTSNTTVDSGRETRDAGDLGSDRDQETGQDLPEVIACGNDIPVASSGTCSVTVQGAPILISGTVLAPRQVLQDGQVLISGAGNIVCVGCDCSGEADFEGATRLDCPNGVISPAFINPHDHLDFANAEPRSHGNDRFDSRQDWRLGARGNDRIRQNFNDNEDGDAWGELRMLMGGAVSIIGVGGVDGLMRNLDRNQQGLSQGDVAHDTFPLDDNDGPFPTSPCNYGDRPTDAGEIANDDAWLGHVAEGVDSETRQEFTCTSSEDNGGNNLLATNTAIVHGMALTANDVGLMQAAGAKLIWSPRTNIDLYGNTASVTLFSTLGIPISLGTDWSISGSMNMLRELHCVDQFNRDNLGGFFSDEQILRMATEWSAVATATDDVIGSLRAGYTADITIFNGADRTEYRAIIEAESEDVVLVMRGGEALYGDEALVADLAGTDGCEVLDVCGVSKRLCLEREYGMDLDTLESSVGGEGYPLFFCDTPPTEPSCVPFRPGEYDGISTSDDGDGDGIANATDNCPNIFNPIRPLDDGSQGDVDNDGLGDVCDVCPFNQGGDCEGPDVDDRDGDGVDDAVDNCPGEPNGEQLDGDTDGIGDACDVCPEVANGGGACPTTVMALRDPATRPDNGTLVALDGVVVTALFTARSNSQGYYIWDPSRGDYAGLYVFTQSQPVASDGTALAEGMTLSLEGEMDSFNDIDQISSTTDIVIESSGATVNPVVINTADLQNGSDSGDRLESMLVRVENVTVDRFINEDDDDFFVTDGGSCSADDPPCAAIGDLVFDGDDNNGQPATQVGRVYASITGPVSGFRDNYTIMPRRASDLVQQ